MSSNTNIGNTPVNQGYVQLIHMGETGGIDGTLRALYDGDGTASDLLIASDKVKISTTLYIGSKTLTEFVQDTVGTMFSSNTETNITVTYQDADGTIDLVSSGEVTLTGSETLTNKTLTSPVINTGISGTAILDEDNMASDSATKLSTQQSIKAYVDTEVAGIVDSAPSQLNTLHELATALGDDANYAASTATAIGLRALRTNNLSDLASATTARSNLGLGTSAVLNTAAVSDGASTLATGNAIYDHITNRISGFVDTSGSPIDNDFAKFTDANTIEGRSYAEVRSDLNIEDGATADQSNAEIRTAVEAATDSNVFTDADHTKLNAIEASADVTDTANVTSAGALMDSEVDADIKTLSLPANTTISATAKTLLDDANTTNMRTTLGLDIGSDVQAFDLGLTNIAGLTTVADKMIYTTASDVYATTTLSAVARTLLDDSTTANMLTTLGLTATAAELNYTDGVSSNIQTQLGTKVPTTRTITPVSSRGISGGGDLSADRTFELSQSQLATVTLNAADNLILFDNSDNDIPKRFVAQDIFDSLGGITIDGTTANGLLTYGGTNNIDTEANLTFDGTDLAIAATGKIYLDGGSHTYISEYSNDNLGFYVGGNLVATMTASQDLIVEDNIAVKDGNKFIAGNGSDYEIYANADGATYHKNITQDADIRFQVNDGGSTITALKIDSSEVGSVLLPNDGQHLKLGVGGDLGFYVNADDSSVIRTWTSDKDLYFYVNDGGVATPAIQIDASDAGTAIFNQDIRLNTNATYLYSKDASGTSTRMFGINGSNTTYIGPIDNYAGGNIIYGANANVDDHDFYTAGTLKMRIKANGNVGIGTASPGYKLDVNGTARFQGSVRFPDSIGATFGDSGDLQIFHNGSYGNITNGTGNLYIDNTTDNADMYFRVDDAGTLFTAMRIDGSEVGNVHLPNDGQNLYIGANNDIRLIHTGDTNYIYGYNGPLYIGAVTDQKDLFLRIYDGAVINAIQIDASDAGTAIFNHDIWMKNNLGAIRFGASKQGNIYENNNDLVFSVQSAGQDMIFENLNSAGSAYVTNLFIDGSAERVGIGTTSPQRKLHVSTGDTNIAARFENTTSNGSVAEFISSGDSRTLTIQTDHIYSNGSLFFGLGNYTNTYRAGTHIFQEDTGNTEVMRITGNNIGIGTSSPSAKLDVVGDMTINGNITMQSGHYITAHNESSYQKYDMYGGNGSYCIGMKSGNSYGGLNNDWAMTFTFNDDADRGFLWRDTAHGTGSGAMALTTNGKLSVAHSARIGYGETESVIPGATYALDVSGSIGATADVVAYVSSDKRLKDNIKNIANPLEKLEKLNGVEFDWNDKQDLYKGHDIGVIAQEVEEVLPEIVETREDGHKAVKYDRMVALLIEAIKEQQKQIDELRKGNFVIETGD